MKLIPRPSKCFVDFLLYTSSSDRFGLSFSSSISITTVLDLALLGFASAILCSRSACFASRFLDDSIALRASSAIFCASLSSILLAEAFLSLLVVVAEVSRTCSSPADDESSEESEDAEELLSLSESPSSDAIEKENR